MNAHLVLFETSNAVVLCLGSALVMFINRIVLYKTNVDYDITDRIADHTVLTKPLVDGKWENEDKHPLPVWKTHPPIFFRNTPPPTFQKDPSPLHFAEISPINLFSIEAFNSICFMLYLVK